jgi:hypothetical protein
MKKFVVMLNLVAAVVMFGFIALVPYSNLTILRTEAAIMTKQGVFHEPALEAYLRDRGALDGRFDHIHALASYWYGRTLTASPFVIASCLAFLCNAILMGIFWQRQPVGKSSPPSSE